MHGCFHCTLAELTNYERNRIPHKARKKESKEGGKEIGKEEGKEGKKEGGKERRKGREGGREGKREPTYLKSGPSQKCADC